MPRFHGVLLLALALAGAPASSAAQAVAGTVVDRWTGAAVPGAVVVLLDTAGGRHDATVSDAQGRYTVRASSAGAFRVRAERVGYSTASSPVLALSAGEQATQPLSIVPSVVTLDAVVARGVRRRCTVRPSNGVQAAIVWDEARKALEAAEVAARRQAYQYRLRRFRRVFSARRLTVQDSSSAVGTDFSGQSFRSPPQDRLVAYGYVEPEGDSLAFHAPDAPTLLSDAFLDHHCFSFREGRRENAGLVGLDFAPLRTRRLPEVRGTLWLDGKTGHLRFVEYTYVNLPYERTGAPLGGRIEFAQVAGGGWIVSRWTMRMPGMVVRPRGLKPVVIGLVETGGEVVDVRTATGEPVSIQP
ncbi:carboxypeptidase-like regulatory domain-containing protein [Longimicrobium sp.]|jgi:hypothetical protein|uniref:carboxypeptidase-like regulatory domain-containing protein n=1 Tax=Longimicrobium sp. TaxID=2029185 RepID=UPI002ED819D3